MYEGIWYLHSCNILVFFCVYDEKCMAIINIKGVLVDILMEIAPYVYGTYVITDRKGVKQLIVQFQTKSTVQ